MYLANQLTTFEEKSEAMSTMLKAKEIAQKFNDASLLQTVGWLEESLTTGEVPNYIKGEKRERKK